MSPVTVATNPGRVSGRLCQLGISGVALRTVQALTYAIQRSCVNKAEVVAEDELEGGVRATLNLGHTFGHAIETVAGYGAQQCSCLTRSSKPAELWLSSKAVVVRGDHFAALKRLLHRWTGRASQSVHP